MVLHFSRCLTATEQQHVLVCLQSANYTPYTTGMEPHLGSAVCFYSTPGTVRAHTITRLQHHSGCMATSLGASVMLCIAYDAVPAFQPILSISNVELLFHHEGFPKVSAQWPDKGSCECEYWFMITAQLLSSGVSVSFTDDQSVVVTWM